MDRHMINVVLLDDDKIMLTGLVGLIEQAPDISVCGHFTRGEEVLAVLSSLSFDVAVLDVELPGLSGIEVARQLRHARRNLPIIMLTAFRHDDWLREALEAGASGFLTKDIEPTQLHSAIREVYAGRPVMSAKPLEMLTGSYVANAHPTPDKDYLTKLETLSVREREIRQLVLQAATNTQIAHRLGIQESTVKTHMTRIFEKLGVQSRIEIVTQAARNDPSFR